MRSFIVSLAVFASLFFSVGCRTFENASDKFFAKNAGNDFKKTQVFEASFEKVFAASKVALDTLSFKADRVAAAQGIIDATRRLLPGDSVREARQLTMRIKVDGAAGGASVSVVIREIAEADFNEHAALGTTKSLSESGLYDLYFNAIAQELAKK